MNQNWIDLNSPTKEEVDSLVLTQNTDPIIAKDLLTPTPAQYAQDKDKIIYVVLHIPAFKHSHSDSTVQEIDFIISENGLTTARYDSIDALHYFAKQIEVSEILNRGENCHIFFGMMKEIYKSMANELASMGDRMEQIEKGIFEGKEKEMVFAISNAGRNLLNFKRIVDAHGNVFEFVRDIGAEKFGKEFGGQAKSLVEEWRRIMRTVNSQMDLAIELRETNNSMLSTKQNEIMKNLAVIGSILLPLTIIGQIVGWSVHSFPLMDNPNAFWIIMGLMTAVMLISIIFARLKKWM
jgi:Mg2+ and Co2+ transporter CorA